MGKKPRHFVQEISLECRHTIIFKIPPLIGEQVWCFKCGAYVAVLDAPDQYRIVCKDCDYRKEIGGMLYRANAAIGSHRLAKRSYGHRMELWEGARLYKTFDDEQLEIGAIDDERAKRRNERRNSARESQRNLREALDRLRAREVR